MKPLPMNKSLPFDLAKELAENEEKRVQLSRRIGIIQSELGEKLLAAPSPLLQELLSGYTALQQVIGKIESDDRTK